mmetsp:Transcript_6440/g.18250  ORF Transcript_6440/g.18250 Transcript_6440/m.18250 type:complete len:205 (-) Transcript_6440:352-966(-)
MLDVPSSECRFWEGVSGGGGRGAVGSAGSNAPQSGGASECHDMRSAHVSAPHNSPLLGTGYRGGCHRSDCELVRNVCTLLQRPLPGRPPGTPERGGRGLASGGENSGKSGGLLGVFGKNRVGGGVVRGSGGPGFVSPTCGGLPGLPPCWSGCCTTSAGGRTGSTRDCGHGSRGRISPLRVCRRGPGGTCGRKYVGAPSLGQGCC